MAHGHHFEVVSRLCARGFKGFHVEGVVRMTGHDAMVDALLLFELKPGNEVRVVFTVRRQHDIAFFPRESMSDLIDGMGRISSEHDFIGCCSVEELTQLVS